VLREEFLILKTAFISSVFRLLFASTTVILYAILVAGCSNSTSTGEEAKPVLNIIALDRSGSTQHIRPEQVKAFRAAFNQAAKWGEEVTVYVVDRKASCIFEKSPLKRGQKIPASVIKELETPPSDRSTKTRPALFWEKVAEEYATKTDHKIRVVYLTDGGNDWYGEEKRVAEVANEIAKNPNISIALLGLSSELRDSVKEQFKAFDESRLLIKIGADELRKGIAELRSLGER